MKQLFSVGELVVINSINQPEHGQIHVIKDVMRYQSDIGYKLNTDKNFTGVKFPCYWDQRNLRKYYPPSTKSFSEIMADLKKPVSV